MHPPRQQTERTFAARQWRLGGGGLTVEGLKVGVVWLGMGVLGFGRWLDKDRGRIIEWSWFGGTKPKTHRVYSSTTHTVNTWLLEINNSSRPLRFAYRWVQWGGGHD